MVERARLRVPDADAEDVANAALCDAHAPNRDRPPASEVPRMKCWLDTLVDFRAKAHWKTSGRRSAEMLCEDIGEQAAIAQDIDIEGEFEKRDWVRTALESLPKDRRSVLLACSVEKTPIEEIAEELGVSPNAIYQRHHKAKIELREKLRQLADETYQRIRLFFPFLFLRWCWKWITGRTRDAHRLDLALVGVPPRFAFGAVATIAILGMRPSSPEAANPERIDHMIHATNESQIVVPAVVYGAIAPEMVVVAPSNAMHAVVVPNATPVRTLRNPVTSKRRASSIDDTDKLDDGLLLRARAVYNRREYQRALQLLDEHQAKFPKSSNAGVRESMRALVSRDMGTPHQ